MTQEIVRPDYVGFLNPTTGELLPINVDSAAIVLDACRAQKVRLDEYIRDVTAWLSEQAEHNGTKTFHGETGTVTLKAGPFIDYDIEELRRELEFAGCPQNRIDEAIPAKVEFKVNRSVLKQLASANPEYKAAIERASREVPRGYQADVKLRRQDG